MDLWWWHELSDNIVHMVLARLEGARTGVAGISLFLVPKPRGIVKCFRKKRYSWWALTIKWVGMEQRLCFKLPRIQLITVI